MAKKEKSEQLDITGVKETKPSLRTVKLKGTFGRNGNHTLHVGGHIIPFVMGVAELSEDMAKVAIESGYAE